SKFEQINQLNRALSARVQPGSSFKPLYYAAAIEKEIVTPATMIYDSPVVFWNDDGTSYTPTNYRGEWQGEVLVRYSLARSMNVPSLRVLNRLGFIDAIDITSALLGIPEKEQISRGLVRKYPIGLGVIAVSPIMMAQAFATFPNGGKRTTPVFINYIEDRDGRIVAEPEKKLREEQARKSRELQLLSPQTAYIMTNMLQTTISEGTLRYPTSLVNGFGDMPMAGKTGTTQNWSAIWTVGFSPYYTTAIWIGFDEGSNSLGVNQTGALTAGPIWARYMKAVHENLEPIKFTRPSSGLVEREVTRKNGLLPPAGYQGKTYTEIFRTGTEPREFDENDIFQAEITQLGILRLEQNLLTGGLNTFNNQNTFPDDQPDNQINNVNIDINLDLDIDFDFELDRAFELQPAAPAQTRNNFELASAQGNPLIDDTDETTVNTDADTSDSDSGETPISADTDSGVNIGSADSDTVNINSDDSDTDNTDSNQDLILSPEQATENENTNPYLD
ncbi:MAG: penicillin-binding transpeptidase domain-containing protein, partial [Salinispira sp.]